jgi:hypothetical protein
MIRDSYIISKPGEEIRPLIYSISSHHFYLIAHRLTAKFPILLMKLIVWQKKIDSYFTKYAKSMLINTDVQQTFTQKYLSIPSMLAYMYSKAAVFSSELG